MKSIDIPNLSLEFTATESRAGGTALYIDRHLAYQKRNDLNLYKINSLEPTVIKITNLILLLDAFTDILKWIYLNLYINLLTQY